MTVLYGTKSKLLTAQDITVYKSSGLVTTYDSDNNGSYKYSGYFTRWGCGTPQDGIYLKFNNTTIGTDWTKVTYKMYLTGSASCWNFNMGTSYALSYESIYSMPNNGGMLDFNSSIDKITYSKNCFELPQYGVKMNACDNDSTNMFHGAYITGSYREFIVTRRKGSGSDFGIHHERSCNSTGTDSVVTITDIMVF